MPSFDKISAPMPYTSYAGGWYMREAPGLPLSFHHGGGTWGVSNYMAAYPELDLSIVLLSNVSPLPVRQMCFDMEHIVLKRPFEMPPMVANAGIEETSKNEVIGNYFHNKSSQTGAKLFFSEDAAVVLRAGQRFEFKKR